MTDLHKIRSGDHSTIESIYKNYRDEFVAWMQKLYRCPQSDAREVFHISVITLYENVVSRKLTVLNCSLKTYLFSVGRKKYLETVKSERKYMQNQTSTLVVGELPDVTIDDSGPVEDRYEHIERCLQKLGEPGRTVLQLYYYHGKSMQEIASLLHYKNSSTVKNVKYKYLVRLKKIVAYDGQINHANQFV